MKRMMLQITLSEKLLTSEYLTVSRKHRIEKHSTKFDVMLRSKF